MGFCTQPEVLRCVCDVVCDVVYMSMLLCAVLVVYGGVFAVAVAVAGVSLWYWRVVGSLACCAVSKLRGFCMQPEVLRCVCDICLSIVNID